MHRNPGTSIEVIDLGSDFDRAREQIGVQLMAGESPDVISHFFVDIPHPSVTRLFVDWFPIMAANPAFDEDNFFMNVFHGLATDGRLYNFPRQYWSLYNVVNSGVPGLVEAVDGKDGISYAELMELHRQYAPDGMYLSARFDVALAVLMHLYKFLDLETGQANFYSAEFIDFITHAREATHPDRRFATGHTVSWQGDRAQEADEAHDFLFRRVNHWVFEYFLPFEDETYFVSPMFETNTMGETLILTPASYVLSAGTTPVQRAMALDFMMFTLLPDLELQRNARSNAGAFVSREMIEYDVTGRLGINLGRYYTGMMVQQPWRLVGDRGDAFETLREMLRTAGEREMNVNWRAPQVVIDILLESLEQFHYGLITARQAAEDIQNRLTLILMEME